VSAPADAQFGIAKEVTYGVPVVPATFVPLLTPTLTRTPDRIAAAGAVAGLDILGSEQWNGGNIQAGGNVGMELYAAQTPFLFEMMFGTVSTTGSGPFTDTFTPTSGVLPSATIQIGHPVPLAPVIPSVWTGCKVLDWDLACSQNKVATLGLNMVAQNATFGSRVVADGATTTGTPNLTSATAVFTSADIGKVVTATGVPVGTTILSVTSGTAAVMSANATATGTALSTTIGLGLATATYLAGQSKPLKSDHLTVTIGGVQVDAMDINIKGNNGLNDQRRFLGQTLRKEPLREKPRVYTATLTGEFRDLTNRLRAVNGVEASFVANFTAGTAQVEVSGNVRTDVADSNPDGNKISDEKLTFMFTRPAATNASAIQAKIIRS
jgi:hypothetical protein